MRKLFVFAFSILWWGAYAQETMQLAMEKRAGEMHRVIGLNDRSNSGSL